MRYILILLLFVSFHSFSQKIMVAVEDFSIDNHLATRLYNTKSISLVKNWEEARYVIRLVSRDIQEGIAGALVIAEPLSRSRRVESILKENGYFLYPYGKELDHIVHQSLIIAKDEEDMAIYIYTEIMELLKKDRQEFEKIFGSEESK
jgi:hypothetical protein